MKKLFLVLILIISTILPVYAAREFYIKNESNSELKFLCFKEKECYNINPDIIEIKDKRFVGFGNYHYFDLSTYKYDKNLNTYSVDVLVDRDPFTDLDVCNRSPYDEGNITHLIFSLMYKPLTKKFQATYKGFVSSKDALQYENGKPAKIQVSYINAYYDNNPKYIKDLSDWLKFFNKEIAKTHAKPIYDVEIEYILKTQKDITDYKPIPKNLSAQYKAEVTEIINNGYPIAVKETSQIRQKAHKMYLDVLRNKELYMDYATNNFDTNIDNGEFSLLSKILDVTAKYVPIKNCDALATDYSGAIIEFLNPYFKDNGIETKKLDKLGVLVNKKRKEIEREQETLHRYVYSKDISVR